MDESIGRHPRDQAVATLFQHAGDRTLMDRLAAPDRDKAILRWQKDLERAQSLIDEGRAAGAIPILRSTLEAIGTRRTRRSTC